MVKILTYIKKDNGFTRNGGKDDSNKKIVIHAEEEIEDILGYTRTTMAKTKGSNIARWSKPHKNRLSSDSDV